MNNRDILNNFYLENKSSDFIVDKEYIVKKSKEFFYFGKWKNQKIIQNELLFGLSNGICFLEDKILIVFSPKDYSYLSFYQLKEFIPYYNFNTELIKSQWFQCHLIKIEDGLIKNFYNIPKFNEGGPGFYRMSISNKEIDLLNKFIEYYINSFKKEKLDNESKIQNEELLKQEILKVRKNDLLSSLDKDSDGELDLVDCESFSKLLNKNQKNIIEIDKNYIQKFVKISMYLKSKNNNLQNLFNSINEINNDNDLDEVFKLLKNQVHTYDLLVLHSISMITSLIESDLITFYEIYECFDELGVFNSNWENEVSDKLSSIQHNIRDLMYSIYHMENRIVNSIGNLTYLTQESFSKLNNSINVQLNSIDSSLKFNNLLSTIQTYQVYKINQNTKRIDK